MFFKIAALFLAAATTQTQTTGKATQWVYESGPNKGYLCALMQPDGANYDVFVPALLVNTPAVTVNALTPVPFQHYATRQAAEAAVKLFCK